MEASEANQKIMAALRAVEHLPYYGEAVGQLRYAPAKRYLVATDPSYERSLSDTSRRTPEAQEGPMDPGEVAEFQRQPGWPDAAELRRWDDLSKDPGAETPPLEDFEERWSVMSEHFGGPRLSERNGIRYGIEDAQ